MLGPASCGSGEDTTHVMEAGTAGLIPWNTLWDCRGPCPFLRELSWEEEAEVK